MRSSTLFTVAGLASLSAAQYQIAETFTDGNFFDHFTFITGADPTGGWVNYLDQAAAQAAGIISTKGNTAYIGVDSTTNNVASPGRSSVRLSSNKAYTEMLVVLDLYNMPGGQQGSWPAFWTFGPNWPNSGEIDIIEGVNGATSNSMTVHTGGSCSLNGGGDGTLQPFSTDCDANDDGNAGCSFHDGSNSYGQGFNSAGGGVFAMEWTAGGVSIWRWAQGSQPGDYLAASPNPSGWGPPLANWNSSDASCDFSSQLSQHNIIFDITFCGSWAGQVFDGGLAACQSFVSNNPSAFSDAYWGVNALQVYQKGSNSNNNDGNKPSGSPSASSIASAAPSPSISQASSSSAAVISPSSVAVTSGSAAAASPSTPASSTTLIASPSPASPNANATPTPLDSNDFGTGSQGIPEGSPNANATPTSEPLTSNDFGTGSQGIPEGSEGWKRAADMKMGDRRRRKHLARHLQHAKL